MKALALLSIALLVGCAGTGRMEYIPMTVGEVPLICIPTEGKHPIPVPAEHASGTHVICEQIQPPDYAPCVVDEVESRIWCKFQPGLLWKNIQPRGTHL